ncbi:MAG TPA: VOC family protein [Nocardioides sp.]|jgi:predicted enzyme related to lactoylglutathione lyase|nr:VOC family protein [Nocardioides sp.]
MSLDGEPCWIQLTTDDVDMAISFYGDLFGWSAGEPSEEHQGYRMFFRGDQPVAGLVPTPDGISPSWSVFLATTDLAATLERATAAGGRVLIETWPVGDLGSFAELVDPAGAAIGAWQADTFAGFAVRNQDNAPAWFETLSTRYDETVAFYRDAFGWDTHIMSDTPQFRYTTLGRDQNARAGIMDATALLGDQPSRWQVYLQVADCDETVARAVSVGGELVRAAEDTPYGRMATLTDPGGVQFCVMRANW